jgi:large subunit ribosomal protein L15
MWTWTVKYDPQHFGKYGFKRPQKTVFKFKPVNLSYLDEKANEMAAKNQANEEDGKIVIDVAEMGYNKVLGSGKVTKALLVKAPLFSESAVRKIEEAGGVAETI